MAGKKDNAFVPDVFAKTLLEQAYRTAPLVLSSLCGDYVEKKYPWPIMVIRKAMGLRPKMVFVPRKMIPKTGQKITFRRYPNFKETNNVR